MKTIIIGFTISIMSIKQPASTAKVRVTPNITANNKRKI